MNRFIEIAAPLLVDVLRNRLATLPTDSQRLEFIDVALEEGVIGQAGYDALINEFCREAA